MGKKVELSLRQDLFLWSLSYTSKNIDVPTFIIYFFKILEIHSNIFLFYQTANGLSQRGILSKLQNYQPSTSLLVKQQHHILSGCQTNIRILQDAGDPSKSIQQQQPSILSRISVKGDLVKKASDKPCGQNTYNQLMKFAKCGLSDTIPLLPIFNSFDDHHTKVVPKKITPRGITIYRKFLN